MLSCLPSRKLTQGPPRGGGLVGGSEARIVGGMGWRLGMLGSGVRSHISDLSDGCGGSGHGGQIVVRSRDAPRQPGSSTHTSERLGL